LTEPVKGYSNVCSALESLDASSLLLQTALMAAAGQSGWTQLEASALPRGNFQFISKND
jgi:hypothetical protein